MTPTVKAVYCLDVSSISTCQKPNFEVETREYTGPLQALQSFLGVREGVTILLGSHI